ncbi:hypothetical protein K3495_g12333 [Podosphaera aphanis]|nr:hypothetical protein K3495_g12333 [Podosphaera aphanis]
MKSQKSPPVPQYLTFPTSPPKNCGLPPTSPTSSSNLEFTTNHSHDGNRVHSKEHASLVLRQFTVLAITAFAEQTALNSISPYLPEMISTFPGVNPKDKGLFVGIIASSFALAQLATNFFWGWLSDHIGRKPVMMLGTVLTAICFVTFGFCKSFSQAIAIHILMGLVNGNQGVITSCLGDITDKSNQSRIFVYVPIIYGIGAMSGPALGGLLINKDPKAFYPFLLPNLFSAALLMLDFIVTGLFLRESLEKTNYALFTKKIVRASILGWRSLGNVMRRFLLCTCLPRKLRDRDCYNDDEAAADEDQNESLLSVTEFLNSSPQQVNNKHIFNRDTIILLGTYFIFQLSNISYNSLYPIFASEAEPIGRNLTAKEIGISLSFAGLITVVFQVVIFGKLKEKMGNKATYRAGLLLFFISMIITPWVGYHDSPPMLGWGSGKIWLWAEFGFVLFLKTVASVGGLTSASLLITNAAPSHSVLGTLNGLAQTFSAGGRALGPFLSGGLFTIATTKFNQGGAVLAWSVFAGVALCGFLVSFAIRGRDLESDEWNKDHRGEYFRVNGEN